MAAGYGIEDENGAFKSGEPTVPLVRSRNVTPSQADEEGLAVANASPVAQHIFDVSRGKIALRESLRSMNGNGFQLTFGHRRVLTKCLLRLIFCDVRTVCPYVTDLSSREEVPDGILARIQRGPPQTIGQYYANLRKIQRVPALPTDLRHAATDVEVAFGNAMAPWLAPDCGPNTPSQLGVGAAVPDDVA